jgi:hypothetical protein
MLGAGVVGLAHAGVVRRWHPAVRAAILLVGGAITFLSPWWLS